MSELKAIIAGGGTGGHILPGLAIARELRDAHGADIRFIGTSRGMESRLVPAGGFPLDLIASGPLNRVSPLTRVKSLWAIPRGIAQAMALLRKHRAQVVVSVGGYAAGPAMAAAKLLRIPSIVFEPNAQPGITNRIAGRWARVAAVNFAEAGRFFPRFEVTGIPVRAEFFAIGPKPPGAAPHLLVFGGSQGARILNNALPDVLPELLAAVPGLSVLHQAGASHADAVAHAYLEVGIAPERVESVAFVEDMAEGFARADLVLCRSGASTVAELAAAGKPALLVPFAAAADDHQRRNAEAFAAEGAAVVLPEGELTHERLLAELTALLSDRDRLARMAAAAKAQAKPNAARRIAELAVAATAR